MRPDAQGPDWVTVHLTVNGVLVTLDVDPLDSLLDVIRRRLHLTGTKMGCGSGECGACTVLLGGRPVCACLALATEVTDSITTIEGLSGPNAAALRAAFAREGAFQCGFCTSGQLLTCASLLPRADRMSDAEIAEHLSGNICRCTGYAGILRAVRAAAASAVEHREA